VDRRRGGEPLGDVRLERVPLADVLLDPADAVGKRRAAAVALEAGLAGLDRRTADRGVAVDGRASEGERPLAPALVGVGGGVAALAANPWASRDTERRLLAFAGLLPRRDPAVDADLPARQFAVAVGLVA
jgi:hypothetical protein